MGKHFEYEGCVMLGYKHFEYEGCVMLGYTHFEYEGCVMLGYNTLIWYDLNYLPL